MHQEPQEPKAPTVVWSLGTRIRLALWRLFAPVLRAMGINPLLVVGIFDVKLFGPDGRLKSWRQGRNLIVNTGLAWLAGLISGAEPGGDVGKYLAIGEDDDETLPATYTALGSEVGTRVAGTQSRVQTNVANDTYQCVGTFAAGNGTGSIIEYGLLDASESGTLISRWVDSGVTTKNAADSLEVTYQQIYANAA